MFLTLVNESHDAESLDLLDLTSVSDGSTDLADIQRIVVTSLMGVGINVLWVFPGLFSEQ